MIDSHETISNTPFTLDFVLEQVKHGKNGSKKLKQKLHGYEVKDITGGSGFMSQILQLKFNWEDHKIEPKSIVLKVPGLQNFKKFVASSATQAEAEKMAEGTTEFLAHAHSQEIRFYTIFHKIDPTLKLPKFYYGYEFSRYHNKGLIIMEDLSIRATTLKMLPGLNNEQIEAVIDELAKIHARSWQHPEAVEALYTAPPGEGDEFVEQMKGVSNKLRELKPEVFNDLLDRAQKFFTKEAGETTFYTEPKFGFPPVIVHGDLWSPNILFTKDENENPTTELAAIIDWQSANPGNPCTDIARLLGANTTGEYRRANTERLLKRYKEKVDHHLGQELFSYEQLFDAYRHSLAHACAFFAFGAPMYHDMPSIIYGDHPEELRKELLSRVQMLFEDALELYPL